MIIFVYLILEKTGELDFSTFLTMMHRQIQQEEPKSEILAALRMFDKQKRGYIPASELRAKLTKMGEKLTNKEGNTRTASSGQTVSGDESYSWIWTSLTFACLNFRAKMKNRWSDPMFCSSSGEIDHIDVIESMHGPYKLAHCIPGLWGSLTSLLNIYLVVVYSVSPHKTPPSVLHFTRGGGGGGGGGGGAAYKTLLLFPGCQILTLHQAVWSQSIMERVSMWHLGNGIPSFYFCVVASQLQVAVNWKLVEKLFWSVCLQDRLIVKDACLAASV